MELEGSCQYQVQPAVKFANELPNIRGFNQLQERKVLQPSPTDLSARLKAVESKIEEIQKIEIKIKQVQEWLNSQTEFKKEYLHLLQQQQQQQVLKQGQQGQDQVNPPDATVTKRARGCRGGKNYKRRAEYYAKKMEPHIREIRKIADDVFNQALSRGKVSIPVAERKRITYSKDLTF